GSLLALLFSTAEQGHAANGGENAPRLMPGVGQTRGTVAYGERAESRFAWSGATSRMSDSLLKFGGSPNYLDADKLRHRRTANNPTELLLWENESRRNPT